MRQEMPDRNQILPASTILRDVRLHRSIVIDQLLLVRQHDNRSRYPFRKGVQHVGHTGIERSRTLRVTAIGSPGALEKPRSPAGDHHPCPGERTQRQFRLDEPNEFLEAVRVRHWAVVLTGWGAACGGRTAIAPSIMAMTRATG